MNVLRILCLHGVQYVVDPQGEVAAAPLVWDAKGFLSLEILFSLCMYVLLLTNIVK